MNLNFLVELPLQCKTVRTQSRDHLQKEFHNAETSRRSQELLGGQLVVDKTKMEPLKHIYVEKSPQYCQHYLRLWSSNRRSKRRKTGGDEPEIVLQSSNRERIQEDQEER